MFFNPAHHWISVKLSMITVSSPLRLKDIEDLLWEAALKSAGKAKIFPVCGRSLRAWIVIAVQRMGRQHPLGPKDVSIAEESVTKSVEPLKRGAGDYPVDQMRMWKISPRVNNPKNDDPSLWEPNHSEPVWTRTVPFKLVREDTQSNKKAGYTAVYQLRGCIIVF
jgi:hypothetical protein